MIDNPEYKGEWSAPLVDNPDYKGKWVHPMIPNPEYVADDELYMYKDFGAVGLDLWQVSASSLLFLLLCYVRLPVMCHILFLDPHCEGNS